MSWGYKKSRVVEHKIGFIVEFKIGSKMTRGMLSYYWD